MRISGIIELKDLSLITVTSQTDHSGLAEIVLEKFAIEGINLEYITEGSGRESCVVMSFCVNVRDKDRAMEIVNALESQKILNSTQCLSNVCFIGIYGPHFREKPGLGYHLCHALSDMGINILGISSSISTVSCIILEDDLEKAKEGLSGHFEMS